MEEEEEEQEEQEAPGVPICNNHARPSTQIAPWSDYKPAFGGSEGTVDYTQN